MTDSLLNNNGILKSSNVIKLVAQDSVLKLEVGDAIRIDEKAFERLSTAFFAELERKFL